MNNLKGREDEAEDGRSSNFMRLFGQMMMLPFTVFVQGMELFIKTIQGMQKVADDGMDVMAGGTAAGPAPISQSDHASNTTGSETGGVINDDATTNLKEKINMSDTNLSDDLLKLVRYKILFVKRDYETAFPEREDLVYDNMTGEAFTAWKVAEFIQRLGTEEVPSKWLKKNYPRAYSDQERKDKQYVKSLDEDDKKYLRVYFEVLERYEREEAKYEQQEIDVLKQIRDRI
jgi:hypothetical protein